MGFSPEIRRNELVASARHCCVCHRYKGVKVEVHHIIPKDKGGTDDQENAITLCFDCHCDAGHYNERHPKGSKLSYDELRKAKVAWHENVRRNCIEPYDTEDNILCKYFLVKDYTKIRDICRNKLDDFSLPYPLSFNTTVTNFQKEITGHEKSRGLRIFGKDYDNVEQFLSEYPDAVKLRGGGRPFEWCEYTRDPSEEDIAEYLGELDYLTYLLHKNEVPIKNIVKPLFYYQEDGCGGIEHHTFFYIREIWGLYLALTNLNKKPIRICNLDAFYNNTESLSYRGFDTFYGCDETLIETPKAFIESKQTVVIPLATILPGFDRKSPIEKSARYFGIGEREIVHADYSALIEDCYLIGPSIAPLSVEINIQGNRMKQEFHKFDLTNLYSIDEHLMVGSCPHIFYKFEEEFEYKYIGELFTEGPGKLTKTSFVVPEKVNEVVIAELEMEETSICNLQINNEDLVRNVKILNDQYLRIKVARGDNVKIIGSYQLLNRDQKNIDKFVYHYNRIPTFIRNIKRKDQINRYGLIN